MSVGVSVCLSGFFIERTVRERIVSEAQASLESVLRLGASRAVAEARLAHRSEREFIEDRLASKMDQFSWFVEGEVRSRRAPNESSDEYVFANLSRTEAFPADAFSTAELPVSDFGVRFTVIEGADGDPYRVASFISMPGLDGPSGPQRGRGRGAQDGPGPPSRRGGPHRGELGRGRSGGPSGPSGPGGPFRPDESFRVSVATAIGEERAFLEIMMRTLLLAGALVTGLSGLLIPWAVRRGLRPVRNISEEIGRVDADRLDQALDIEAPPAELAPIVQSFEDARERLNDAFVREKRFTSDAAHELRTPLAGLRASMEVALRRERSAEHYRGTFEECLGITESMQGMVESLLLLAKGAAHELERTGVDLGLVLDSALRRRADDLSARGLSVRVAPGDAPKVSSNQVLVERIFANVTRNAAEYADQGSTIDCSFEETAEHVSWIVANDAANLPSDTAERAFDPLWRGDLARTDASLHAGLGLSLVAQCVDALEGTVSLETAGKRFAITVTLPR